MRVSSKSPSGWLFQEFALPLPLSKFHFLNADLSANAVLAVLVRQDIFAYVSFFLRLIFHL